MSGRFYFSLVSNQEGNFVSDLFECTVNNVNSIDDIIQEFIDDPYKGVIPFDELEDITDQEVNIEEEEEFIKKYVVNVWSVIIP